MPASGEFSFVVDDYRELTIPSFLIWLFRDTDDAALLCKLRQTKRPANFGMTLLGYDTVHIRLITHGLLNSIGPGSVKQLLGSGREQAADMILMRDLHTVPDDKFDLVKNTVLKSNVGKIDESYFQFEDEIVQTELTVQATDAFYSAFRIFGIPEHDIPKLREHQILDFDISTIFADSRKLGVTTDGKHFFEHNGRRLYVHRVDRTRIEECLGVDFLYNFLDDRRLVFVQYKCQQASGKYYWGSDASHESEITRMNSIPGLADCSNRLAGDERRTRLCRCPVFIKLCNREVAHAHAVPIGVYYPLCVWSCLIRRHRDLSVRTEPNMNNPQFQELVKTGRIGSMPEQTTEIDEHLVKRANDKRMKLVFEETAGSASTSRTWRSR